MKPFYLFLIAFLAGCVATSTAVNRPPKVVQTPIDLVTAKSIVWSRYAAERQAYFMTLPWSGPGRQAWRDVQSETDLLARYRAHFDAQPNEETAQAFAAEVDGAMSRNWLKP